MSKARKNWSALSSLARQWTMEDEEEVERERRRRERGSSSAPAEADRTLSTTASEVASAEEAPGDQVIQEDPADTTDSGPGVFQATSSAEQLQVDFVEMLRVRSEKRRLRQVEALRRQKQQEDEGKEEGGEESKGKGGRQKVKDWEPSNEVFSPSPKPEAPDAAEPRNPNSRRADTTHAQHENEESKGAETKLPTNRTRKFVSSVSISLDQSASSSRCSSPMSPLSPNPPSSPKGWETTSPKGSVQNGHTEEMDSSSSSKSKELSKPSLVRHSSRTVSFRMMRKKEEEISPLQRSASVRMASKKFEGNPDPTEDEDTPSSFQRNSRQRVSARSIQEKMQRLVQAAQQKSEPSRPMDVAHRTLHRLDKVSMKRGMFEKESQAAAPTSPRPSRQEFKSISSGVSDRISRWVSKAKDQTVTSHGAADLRHVNINSKRSLFENISSSSDP